ncbi:MAG TPA: MarR family winged helix-turn-helix transcriptional regulator [bacterium]|nr:MarR family winged helix-turn-helix transcriptional regulator [bacterium]
MGDRVLPARIAAVRAFNRFYTRHIGVLRKDYLASPFSLTQARVLYELAHRRQPTASDLARDLDLDAGYLSRLLQAFEARGLIQRTRSSADGRQQHLVLTRRGRRSFAPLDARSQRDTAVMLRRLPPAGQARLIAAMRTIEALLSAERARAAVAGRPSRRSAR